MTPKPDPQDQTLTELRRLSNEATLGPWSSHDIFGSDYAELFGPKTSFGKVVLGRQADAQFIAASRNHIDEILDYIEKLEKVVDCADALFVGGTRLYASDPHTDLYHALRGLR